MRVKSAPWTSSIKGEDAVKYINGYLGGRVGHAKSAALLEIASVCHAAAYLNGWWGKPRDAGTMIALIHSEVSEMLEGVRKGLPDEHLPHRSSEEVECADAIIRLFDYAAARDLDIGGAIVDKLMFNAKRADHQPAQRKKRGGKKF